MVRGRGQSHPQAGGLRTSGLRLHVRGFCEGEGSGREVKGRDSRREGKVCNGHREGKDRKL